MTTPSRLHHVDLGTIDGERVLVARKYRGDLPEAERKREIAGAMHVVADVLHHTAETGGDVLAAYRREFVDLLAFSLNLGLLPARVDETLRDAGAEVGIDPGEVERLVGELRSMLAEYTRRAIFGPGEVWSTST